MAVEPNLPLSCTTPSGWTIAVTQPLGAAAQGPCATNQTSQTGPLACTEGGVNTGIEYTVSGTTATPDHVFSFVHVTKAGDVAFVGGGNEGVVYPLCQGDTLSGVGAFGCHEQAARLNAEAGKANTFKIILNGQREAIGSSVVVKKGKTTDSCKIVGLGLEVVVNTNVACVSSCGNFDPHQTIKKLETIKFKGCAATFEYDLTTGEVVNAFADHTHDDQGVTCSDMTTDNVDQLTVSLANTPIGGSGIGRFGDGFISTGNDSCTTRVIGGKVYTWGTAPCP
jgi:hypothetical protein